MEEMWVQIKEFPMYSVSSEGRIRNDVHDRLVKTSKTPQGAVKVGLISGREQHTRSVKVLVADGFVRGYSDIFNTPIHLDGDQSNNDASNIVWRPRWFAWKYKRQFEHTEEYLGLGPVVDRKTGLVYKDIVDAALTNGLLYFEVQLSLVNKVPVFPTFQMFDWLKEENQA